MMKKLLAGIFLLTHILAHGQYMPLNFGARISVTSVTPTAPHTYRITGLVQDNLSKWNASDVQASQDSVYHLGGSNLYNYRISSIQSAAGNSITMTLVDQDSTGDYPSTGTEWAVVKFTPANKFPYWLSGVSDNLNSAIQNRFVQRLDESLQGGVNIDTAFYLEGNVNIITTDSVVHTAAIPVVTTAINGLMPNTDYKRIKNTYTQITSTGQSVNINMDNGYNYYINIIGDNGGIGLPTKSGSFVSGDKLNIFFYNQSSNPRNVLFPGQYYKYADGSPVDTVTLQNADALGMSFVYTQGNIWYMVESPKPATSVYNDNVPVFLSALALHRDSLVEGNTDLQDGVVVVPFSAAQWKIKEITLAVMDTGINVTDLDVSLMVLTSNRATTPTTVTTLEMNGAVNISQYLLNHTVYQGDVLYLRTGLVNAATKPKGLVFVVKLTK